MRKKLLLAALAMVCTTGAFAYEVGDYILAPQPQRFKVIGADLVKNGSFADQLDNWTEDTEVWGIAESMGPNGENVVESKAATDSPLAQEWSVSQPGLYAVCYYIQNLTKADVNKGITLSKVTTAGETVSYNHFVSAGGTWAMVVDTISAHTGETIRFSATSLPVGTQITNISLHAVEEVYDVRIVERLIAYAEKLLQEPDLSEGRDEFEGIVSAMKEAVADPQQNEVAEAMEALIADFNTYFDEFMNNNGGNTNSGDWSTHASANWNNMNNATIAGSWKSVGDRWGFSNMGADKGKKWSQPSDYVGYLERPENDGYVATAAIQRGQNQSGTVRGVVVTRTDLEPGKYFIAIEAQAVSAAVTNPGNNGWRYDDDHTRVWSGPSMFVGTDTLVMRPATEEELAAANPNYKYTDVADTLNGYYWKRYYMIGEVKEGGTVQAGFLFPPYYEGGFKISLRNPEFRQIGKSEMQLNWESALKNVWTQQRELENRLANYPTDVAGYIWEKDSLQRAIEVAEPVLLASYDQAPQDSTCSIPVTEAGIAELNELKDALLAQVNALSRAKNWIINQNAVQDDIKTAMANGQAVLDNPLNADGDAAERAKLQAAVSAAQALIDGITEVNQNAEFKAAIAEIEAAIVSFKITCASRQNPAEISIQNGDFSLSSGNKTSTSFTDNGWTFTGTGTYKQWQFGTAGVASYANQWRGSTVTLGGKAQQTVTLTAAGVYEYRAAAYATNDNNSYRMATAALIYDENEVVVDTTFDATPVRLFFGLDGTPDSIVVSKCYAPHGNSKGEETAPFRNLNGKTPLLYSVYYVKTSNEPEVVEFGLEADPLEVGTGLNAFGFGDNHVFYVGAEGAYTSALDADLQAEVARATALMAQNEDESAAAYFLNYKIKRFQAAAASAATMKAKQNIYLSLKELDDVLEECINESTGINTTVATNAEAFVKGIFTLTGVKVGNSMKNLKKGLYIVNGKKYLVK
jgi:hypothetical protein